MAKIAIFSDLHLHPFQAFATVTPEGLNSRLVSVAQVLDDALQLAESEHCDFALFGGDFFHTRKLDVETIDIAAQTLGRSSIPILAVAGNHDEADALGDLHSLRGLRGRIRCIDESEGRIVTERGLRIGGVSYCRRLEDFKARLPREDVDILVIHAGLTGAAMGADFIADEKGYLTTDEVAKFAGRLVISGHFHQPQLFSAAEIHLPGDDHTYKMSKTTDVLIPGAPLQHNFGDEGSIRGMWICDTNKSLLSFRRLESPEFRTVHSLDEVELLKETDFIKVEANVKLAEKIRKKIKAENVVTSVTAEAKVVERRSDLSLSDSDKSLLEKYAKMYDVPADYVSVGLEFLR